MDYIYRLKFTQATARQDIDLSGIDCVIRTNIGPGIDTLEACDLFYRTHLMNNNYSANAIHRLSERCTGIELLNHNKEEANALRDKFTIRTKTPAGRVFYDMPIGSVKITFIRTDGNDEQEPFTDIITVPSNVYNASCSSLAIKQLFWQIAVDFYNQATEEEKRDMYPDGAQTADWNAWFRIPDSFHASFYRRSALYLPLLRRNQ